MKIATRTLVAVAKATVKFIDDHHKGAMQGVCLCHTGHGRLLVEATDGHRAAQVTIDIDAEETEFNIILTKKTWIAIRNLKLSRKDRKDITTLDLEHMRLTQCDGRVLPLVDISIANASSFPPVSRVIRAHRSGFLSSKIEVGLNTVYMKEAFESASHLSNPKFKDSTLITTNSGSVVTIEVNTNHGNLPGLTRPALFSVMPMRV